MLTRKNCHTVISLIFLTALSLSACDVNLIEILSGDSSQDKFSGEVLELPSHTRNLGQTLSSGGNTKKPLSDLLKTWIRFDNNFSHFPPVWASTAAKWKHWMKEMVGMFDFMPMTPDNRIIMNTTDCMQELDMLLDRQDREVAAGAAPILSKTTENLRKIVPAKCEESLKDFRKWVVILEDTLKNSVGDPFKKASGMLSLAE